MVRYPIQNHCFLCCGVLHRSTANGRGTFHNHVWGRHLERSANHCNGVVAIVAILVYIHTYICIYRQITIRIPVIVMEIIADTIIFRTSDEYYFKEREGLKKNTVRRLTAHEINAVILFMDMVAYPRMQIRIMRARANTNEGFQRVLTDISEWQGLWIFSWK